MIARSLANWFGPLLLAYVIIAAPTAVRGQTPDSAVKSQGRKIRVLLTYGGHGDAPKSLLDILDRAPDIEYTKAALPESADLLKPGLEEDYQVLAMYDMVQGISEAQQNAFAKLLKDCGMGVVSLHHNLCANRNWDEFADIVGGKYVFSKTWQYRAEGKPFGISSHKHGDITVTVADRNHPITEGVEDFKVHDEIYIHYFTAPNIHGLLTSRSLSGGPVIAWTHTYGKSPVFTFILGHGDNTWQEPAYGKLLLNGIRWACRR